MRILFVTGAFPPMRCGVGDYIALLESHMSNFSGITTGVLTSIAAGCNPEPPLHFFPVVQKWNLTALAVVLRALKEFQPDIVHLQYPASFGRVFLPNFLPLICSVMRIPMVQTWHEHPIYSQLINSIPADTLVVVEPRYPAEYRQPYRTAVRHKKSICIPIGSNMPKAVLSPLETTSIRERFNALNSRMIVYFGFAQPFKGLEHIFEAADPLSDRLVLICDLDPADAYQSSILHLSETRPWGGNCFVTGYLPADDISRILASADAAVFPFIHGATTRNGSILAARLQGTFVVTTHLERRGYDAGEHTSYVAPGHSAGMRKELDRWAGKRIEGVPPVSSWQDIAERHTALYSTVLETWRCRN